LVVAIAGGFGGIVWQYRKTLGANGQLTELRDRQTIEIATALHARGRTPTAIARLARTIRENPANGRAAALLASIVQSTRWPVPCFTLGRETSGAEVIAVSPDEQHLATLRAAGPEQIEIATWSVSDGRSVARWTCPATNEADLSFSQDSSSVHLWKANGSMGWLLDGTPASAPIPTEAEPSEPWPDLDWLPRTNKFSVSRQLRRAAVGNGIWNTPAVSLLDLDTRRPVTGSWKGEELTPRGGFGPDLASGMLVTALNNTLRWRDGRNGELLGAFLETGGVILDATWAPSGRWIAVSSLSDPVSAWTLSQAFHPAPLWTNDSFLRSVRFNATGDKLAISTGTNGTYGIHPDGTEIHLGSAWTSAWFADGERLALGGQDGIVEVRRFSDPSWSGPKMQLPSPADIIAVSPDQQWLAAATHDQKLYVWNASTGAPLGDAVPLLPVGGNTWGIARVFGLQFSPDSQRLVVAAASTGAIVELTGLRITYRLGASTPCTSATFSPDGQWAAFGTMSNDITIVSVAPKPRTQMRLEGSDTVLSVSFSANSKRMISCSDRGSVRVYSVPEGRLVHDLVTEGSTVQWADFSNDGGTLAALSYDGQLWLWDAEYGLALAAPLRLSDRKLTRGHFSADGRKLAIGSIGGAVWVVPLIEHSGPAPEWLAALAEGLVGQRFNADGTWERVPPKEFLAVLDRLRKAPPEGHWREWCQRFLSPIPKPRTGAVPQP
jgi:WD40 repeat protein